MDWGDIKMMHRNRVLILGLCLAALVACSVGVYVTRVLFRESAYVTRDSFAYHICVSKLIKKVPLVNPHGEEMFYCSAGDGPKPPQTSVIYYSKSEPEFIYEELVRYLQGANITMVRDDGDTEIFASSMGFPKIRVKFVESANATLQVVVEEVY